MPLGHRDPLIFKLPKHISQLYKVTQLDPSVKRQLRMQGKCYDWTKNKLIVDERGGVE